MWPIFDLTTQCNQRYSSIQHMQYILITSTLSQFRNPTTWVHPNEKIKIQPNEMVKMTYVPNRIWIPTHGGDLGHYRLRMEERTMESPMEPPQPKRGGGRKRKNCRCDLCISRALYSSVVETMCHDECHRGGQSRQCGWRDPFISHVNWTGATQKGQVWKKQFGRVHFSKIILKGPKWGKFIPRLPLKNVHESWKGLGRRSAPSSHAITESDVILHPRSALSTDLARDDWNRS
jgi:hypothetical protein